MVSSKLSDNYDPRSFYQNTCCCSRLKLPGGLSHSFVKYPVNLIDLNLAVVESWNVAK